MKVLLFVLMSFFGVALMAQDGDATKSVSKTDHSVSVTTTEDAPVNNNTIIIIAVVGGVVLLGIVALVAGNRNKNRQQ